MQKQISWVWITQLGPFFLSCVMFVLHSLPVAAAAKSPQSCPTLCDPIDSSPSGSPVPGIRQARVLEWGAISVSITSCRHQAK